MKKPIHICHVPETVLREQCVPIAPNAITSPETNKILSEMSQALAESGDGVAIAAPQIGYAVRIFVVSGQILDVLNNYHGEHISPDKVFINPEIIKASKVKKTMKGEGCLSVRFIYGATKRSEKVTVKATDEKGNEFTMSATGLLAQIFQHEIDHLNGILFVDHATGIREMTDEEKASYQIELEKMKAERMNIDN